MKILVTNDDGILAKGLRILASELNNVAPVVVVAPDREQSAIGTAVTLHQLLRERRLENLLPEIEAYAVEGTPADSVILALGKLVKDEIGLVVAGINQGLNLGDDVLISGTVGAAVQGYLRGLPALAVSTDASDSLHLDKAARLAALLARRILGNEAHSNVFLNVNLPRSPSAIIKGIEITRLASRTHIDTVEESRDWKGAYYRLVRRRVDKDNDEEDEGTDVWAVRRGNISITPLHAYLASTPSPAMDSLVADLLGELENGVTHGDSSKPIP